MQIHELKPCKNSTFTTKRKGCGVGSGLGKTSGRGHKGQNSRSGGGVRPGFEGGQTPLYRRLPRRGFSNFNFADVFEVVNVTSLAKLPANSDVNAQSLKKAGLVSNTRTAKLKILGNGELNVALNVTADKFTKSAKEKIIAAGGSCTILGQKEETPTPKKKAAKVTKAETKDEPKPAEATAEEVKKTAETKKEEKPAVKKTADKKTVAKKTVAKKTVAKKTTAKKTTAKKTAAKKTATNKPVAKKEADPKEVKDTDK